MVFDKVYRVHQWVSFLLYSVTFVVTILSFKRGIIKYQFEQLTWTLLTIIMVVSQMNLAVYNIFEGLFWFLFPCSLVVCNDCFAYFCGFAFGGKIFKDRKGAWVCMRGLGIGSLGIPLVNFSGNRRARSPSLL